MYKSEGTMKYRYGVQRSKTGKTSIYLCRVKDESELVSREDRYPEKDGGIVLKEEVGELTASEAYSRAEEMLRVINCPGMYSVVCGDIAHHSDCQGSHQAVVLGDYDEDMVQAVFFTSSFGFGVRKATIEELGCAGYRYSKDTFLAPVIRPRREFVAEGSKFPDYRVQELIEEFFPGVLLPEEKRVDN